jgi:hypothetical protein
MDAGTDGEAWARLGLRDHETHEIHEKIETAEGTKGMELGIDRRRNREDSKDTRLRFSTGHMYSIYGY